ncbi:MAG: site-specific tyrosine recombinase XerD [Cellulomonas iranensis]|uniref:site-specific tyrosine recombinase XerD n=1 Tax=Cellulomonas TaxID=1707 RepID=UPI000B3C7CC6|nr:MULTISPECIES: site-specific tyrosine recombinase XerD [Cellulomonas]MBO9567455.1 site-specific tyrosine recombinase XerD [Cellulomonas iranensis]TFH69420.1 site-specific tyrosine recombinase XerD [Cellulomonas sp. HD19AZ1]UCN16296.1 site-specific tyrosine recombinase XerD [Cellulomonas iranensis]
MPDRLTSALEGYLAHLSVERGLATHTLSAYRRDLTRYVAHLHALGRDDPSQITERDVEDYLLVLRTGSDGRAVLSASSSARSVVAVRGWHRFLALDGLAPTDAAADVRPPAQPRRLPKAISVEDVGRLIDAAGLGDGPVPLRDRALLELVYSTGARISEAVGVDVDDLDLTAGRSAVRLLGKGRKERVVPVGSFAAEAVEAYLVRGRPALAASGRGNAAVFLNTRGARLSRQSAWAVLRTAAERAGLDTAHVSPHTLRHSFATHLLAGGADVRVVQELLGHASVTTTQIYTMVTPDTLREVYAASHPRAR